MSMLGPGLFYLSSFATIAGGLGTILSRSAIRSAVSLLVAILGVAGLYLCLSAQLLAAVQLIVYAGAVVVLFVFVVMMLGPTGAIGNNHGTLGTRILATGLFGGSVAALLGILWHNVGILNAFDLSHLRQVPPSVEAAWPHVLGQSPSGMGTVRRMGEEVFGQGLVAFELSGLVLLIAIVTVIAIARGRPSAQTGTQTLTGEGSRDEEAAQ